MAPAWPFNTGFTVSSPKCQDPQYTVYSLKTCVHIEHIIIGVFEHSVFDLNCTKGL